MTFYKMIKNQGKETAGNTFAMVAYATAELEVSGSIPKSDQIFA